MGHQASVDVICSQIEDHNIWNMQRLMTNWYVSIYFQFYPIWRSFCFSTKQLQKKEMDTKYQNAENVNTPQLICPGHRELNGLFEQWISYFIESKKHYLHLVSKPFKCGECVACKICIAGLYTACLIFSIKNLVNVFKLGLRWFVQT